MQAVILAGGLGTRLWPITQTIPKPMAPLNGVPYLEYQLRLLARQGVRDVLLLTGYLGEQIQEHFGDGSRLGLDLRYSREPAPLGTGGALRHARAALDSSFLLIYGDSYLPIDYPEVLRALAQSSIAEGVVVVYDNRLEDTSVKNNIDLDAQSFITRYDKGSPDPLQYVDAGVLAFRREVVDLIPGEGVVSLETQIFPKLIAARQLLGYVTTQRFYDIGTPERLELLKDVLAQ